MTSTANPPPPMMARAAEAPTSSAVPSPARPAEILDHVRRLIGDGQVGTARRLLAAAARRFPDHPGIRLAKRILGKGKATPNPFVQPTAAAESEWLDNPPDQARGKWVALIGSELIDMADSVEELMASLKSRNLRQLPLVHHLAS